MRNTVSREGFSLIEVVLTTSLVSIVSLLSLSFYARFFSANSLSNTMDQIVGSLRKAQIYTLMGKENTQWGVTLSSSKVVMFAGSSYAARNTSFDETFTVEPSVTVSGLGEVVFNKVSGQPSTTPTVTVAANNSSKNLTVNSLGVVSR